MELFLYNPRTFNALPSLNEAQKKLRVNQHALEELGRVIGNHGLQSDVGIALLHRHVELQNGERLVEFVDPIARRCEVRPCGQDTLGIPHLFGLLDGVWQPVEFVTANIGPEVVNRIERVLGNSDFLTEFAATLTKLQVTDTFGISIAHGRESLVNPEEILLESTLGRMSILEPAFRSDEQVSYSTPTIWRTDGKTCTTACVCQAVKDHPHVSHGK